MAGLDPLSAAEGPTSPTGSLVSPVARVAFAPAGDEGGGGPKNDLSERAVQVRDTTVQSEQTNTVPVQLIALGDENALGFSLTFDKLVLGVIGATTGSGASGGTPERQMSGPYRLTVANADGSMIESQKAGGINLWATTNLLLNATNWTRLTNPPFWTNGLLLWDDGNSTNHPWRFYRATEP